MKLMRLGIDSAAQCVCSGFLVGPLPSHLKTAGLASTSGGVGLPLCKSISSRQGRVSSLSCGNLKADLDLSRGGWNPSRMHCTANCLCSGFNLSAIRNNYRWATHCQRFSLSRRRGRPGPSLRSSVAQISSLSVAASLPPSTPATAEETWVPPPGAGLQDFLRHTMPTSSAPLNYEATQVPYLEEDMGSKMQGGRMYVETYGCQMNVNDMEIVLAIMKEAGYTEIVDKPEESDIIFINTCAIRENAEHKIWHRLNYFKHLKSRWNCNVTMSPSRPANPPKVAVLGCMAERLKEKLIIADKMVDVVCGPDAYRDLPRLLALVDEGQAGINTLLSLEETYADVSPVRIAKNSVTAFVSIMRGCNNMCSFCIVPFTRGRERSRPVDSIVREVGELWEQGVKEVMLLGQNVNSYNDRSGNVVEGYDGSWFIDNDVSIYVGEDEGEDVPSRQDEEKIYAKEGVHGPNRFKSSHILSPGFSTIYKIKEGGLRFSHLLDCLSIRYPEMRFRFTSPHPKDFPDDLLHLMRNRPNICNMIHLPAQSGSSRMLDLMRRGYTREAYLACVERIRTILPDVSISSDFIAGFCGETEEDHKDTLSLIEAVSYDMAYMFAYSMRERTHAHRNYTDDVPEPIKQGRLAEMISTFRRTTLPRFESQLGTTQLVLVEGPNKRAPETELIGKSDKGHKVIFPNVPVLDSLLDGREEFGDTSSSTDLGTLENVEGDRCLPLMVNLKPGDYVEVHITGTTVASLRGEPLARTKLTQFYQKCSQSEIEKEISAVTG